MSQFFKTIKWYNTLGIASQVLLPTVYENIPPAHCHKNEIKLVELSNSLR
jgi:hypothetical protein